MLLLLLIRVWSEIECGILDQVWNRVGKNHIFCSEIGKGPHTPTQNSGKYPPPPPPSEFSCFNELRLKLWHAITEFWFLNSTHLSMWWISQVINYSFTYQGPIPLETSSGSGSVIQVTRIMMHQRNRWIVVQSGIRVSFGAPWSEWAALLIVIRIILKERIPRCFGYFLERNRTILV